MSAMPLTASATETPIANAILRSRGSAACKMPNGSPAQAAETKYRLFGVVEHMGSLKSGHYVAYVRTGEDAWVYASDSQTEAVSQEKVLGAQASILCYELVQ